MYKVACLVTIILVDYVTCDPGDSRIIKLEQGPVRGHMDVDGGIFVYRGIPYATAPTGRNKFKEPLPPPVWSEPLEATAKDIICPQVPFPMMSQKVVTQEDCLIANVYVPEIVKAENLPVVVYVHGGAFQVAYGDFITFKKFIRSHKVIGVTFNYRLGAHGFLCLGTKDVPGNAGMKDQVALLRWVQKNIVNFGGNPDDVTIAGYSAGSVSVDLLMLAKSAKGLFHKVIPESGANVAAFTIQSDPLMNAKIYAKQLAFENVEDVYALEEFYKTVPIDLLMSDAFMNRTDSTFMFSPCIERGADDETFINEDPVDILKSGNYPKVPMLYGFANMEGLMRIELFDTWKDKMNDKFSDFLPADLIFEDEEQREAVSKTIKEFYFGDKPVSSENVLSYVDYFSDVLFTYGMLRAVKLHLAAGHDKIYLYEYSFVDENTPVVPYTDVRGANHCAQTMAIFDGWVNVPQFDENTISKEFKEMKAVMRQIWSNFIKTGNPVPEGSDLPAWPPVSKPWSPHMSLGKTLELRGSLLQDRMQFWDDIYSRYYRVPVPPPAPLHTEL